MSQVTEIIEKYSDTEIKVTRTTIEEKIIPLVSLKNEKTALEVGRDQQLQIKDDFIVNMDARILVLADQITLAESLGVVDSVPPPPEP